MKVRELQFVTDVEIKPQKGESIPKALKEALIQVSTIKGPATIEESRVLWRALDDLEASSDSESVKLGESEYTGLKKAWETNVPQANPALYKWLKVLDKVILDAKEVKE